MQNFMEFPRFFFNADIFITRLIIKTGARQYCLILAFEKKFLYRHDKSLNTLKW